MSRSLRLTCVAVIGLYAYLPLPSDAATVDVEKAHATAIRNCVNWNGKTLVYCTCVQDKVRADLSNESYLAMMKFAEAYQQKRRADLAAMQVDMELSKALEPVDDVVTAAQDSCKG